MPSNESFVDESVNTDHSRYAFKPGKLRIVCIGGGFSGLILAYKLKHEQLLEFVDFTIYEKNHEVGGAWLENIYPGVGCDIPAHSYVFPFEPNPSWSECYARGPEIHQYMLSTVQKYGLKDPIVFNTQLVKSVWDESSGKWLLDLKQNDGIIHDEADILIDASGILNRWRMPDVDGIDKFAGKLVHTAAWDKSYNWDGKKVAVIGNGSSGIQIVPALQPKAAKLVNYIRGPTWVSVNLCPNITKDGMGGNFQYSEEEEAKFRDDPEEFLRYLKCVERSVNSVYSLMISGSDNNNFLHNATEGLMRQRLAANPHLIDKLIPKWEVGCRRLSLGDGYLEAMQKLNSSWCLEPIEEITKTGIRTASGWEFIRRDGRQLDKEWKNIPEAYFSLCAAAAPNYFMFMGPNCPIGHGSVPQMLGWAKKMAREKIKSVAVKDSVVSRYNRRAQSHLKKMVWSKGCHSWYNNGSVVTAMYPGSVLHFKDKSVQGRIRVGLESNSLTEAIETIRGEDFDIQHTTPDSFNYLGNGELDWEGAEGADTAFYLR